MKAIDCAKVVVCICGGIVWCASGAQAAELPPDPDNAALLYYQAALRIPELSVSLYSRLKSVQFGADPDELVREYTEERRDVIRLAEAATRIPQCSWGTLYSQGDSLRDALHGRLLQLPLHFNLNARILSADGDCVAALGMALNMRCFAAHIADGTIYTYNQALQFDTEALICIADILGSTQVDSAALVWLQAQLATVQGPPPAPGRTVQMTLDHAMHPASIARWREEVAGAKDAAALLALLDDEQVLERARELAGEFSAHVQAIIGIEKPYSEKYAELSELADGLFERHQQGDPVVFVLFWGGLSPQGLACAQYNAYVRHLSRFNAVRAAAELYLEKAQNGELPDTLPSHLPPDPFSGQDFEYQITDEGFTLRCRAEEIGEGRIWEFEFDVAQ